MKLTVQSAEVKTATVEIKTLTVSGKQVTLATFRQLREEDPLDDGYAFKGLPWGWVNYHPDERSCRRRADHLHVVWQKGSELRRGLMYAPDRRYPAATEPERIYDLRWREINDLPQLFIAV